MKAKPLFQLATLVSIMLVFPMDVLDAKSSAEENSFEVDEANFCEDGMADAPMSVEQDYSNQAISKDHRRSHGRNHHRRHRPRPVFYQPPVVPVSGMCCTAYNGACAVPAGAVGTVCGCTWYINAVPIVIPGWRC